MATYIIGWYPGNLKGMTQQQTASLIWGGCQMWSKMCNVRFRSMQYGERPHITFAPYPSTTWAMGAYQATGQILFSTLQTFQPKWARMGFAHELGHIFGWDHVSRTEALMNPRGSSVLYFDATEGRATWGRFGKPSKHYPESLQHVGADIRELQAKFVEADNNVKKYIKLRDAATTSADKQKYNALVQTWAKRRTDVNVPLSTLSAQWKRIDKEWRNVNGILQYVQEEVPPCLCFSGGDDSAIVTQAAWDELFTFPAPEVEPIDSVLDSVLPAIG
jgi:hypothetical protein